MESRCLRWMCLRHEGIVMSGSGLGWLICPSFIVALFARLATQTYCFLRLSLVSGHQTRIASQSVRQDMIKMLRAIFFTISMRSSSQQKPGSVPRKQWNERRASGQGEWDMIGVLISESWDKTKCHLKFYLSSLSRSIYPRFLVLLFNQSMKHFDNSYGNPVRV